MVSRWCLGGVSAASMLIQGVHGVLVVSWRRRVGGVGAVALVVLGCVSVVFPCASRKSNLECVFLIRSHHAPGSLQRLHAVVMVTIMTAEDDCDNEEMMVMMMM